MFPFSVFYFYFFHAQKQQHNKGDTAEQHVSVSLRPQFDVSYLSLKLESIDNHKHVDVQIYFNNFPQRLKLN